MGAETPYIAAAAYIGDQMGITNTGVADSGPGKSTSKFLGFGVKGPTLNEQLAMLPKQNDTTPNRTGVTNDEFANEKKRLQRNRQASTLLTGGQGVLEQPTLASRTLLGV